MKKPTKMRARLVLWHAMSLLVSIAPLALTLIIRRESYTSTPAETVKLGLGTLMALGLIVLKVLGRLKLPSDLVLQLVVFAMAYLLDSVLDDLLLLVGMSIVGTLADKIFFARRCKALREGITTEKTADATAAKVEEVLKNYMGGRT